MGDGHPSVLMVISHDRDRSSFWDHSIGGSHVGTRSAAYRADHEGGAGIEDSGAAAALGLGGVDDTVDDRILPLCFGSHALLGEQGVSHQDGDALSGGAECPNFSPDRLSARVPLGRGAGNASGSEVRGLLLDSAVVWHRCRGAVDRIPLGG